jgi:hypothetical protein
MKTRIEYSLAAFCLASFAGLSIPLSAANAARELPLPEALIAAEKGDPQAQYYLAVC